MFENRYMPVAGDNNSKESRGCKKFHKQWTQWKRLLTDSKSARDKTNLLRMVKNGCKGDEKFSKME